MKGKVKTFLKEHKSDIITGIVVCAGGAIGGGIAYHLGWTDCLKRTGIKSGDIIITDNKMINFFNDAVAAYPKGRKVNIGTIYDGAIPIEKLGELGERLKEIGAPDGCELTHFLVMGDAEK